MSSPERQQTGWWGGISSLSSTIFSSASKRRHVESEKPSQPQQPFAVEPISQATPRPRVSFQDDYEPSPESPVRRASVAQLANRKIFDRPLGPSNKLSASTARTTNFSPAVNPRPMFRATYGPDAAKFSFSNRANVADSGNIGSNRHTSRAPAGFLRDSFNIRTPQRDLRASTEAGITRGASKTPTRDLFPLKIPEPPAHLTGEAIANKVPHNPDRVGSVYADEFLADLCPKEFNETQRKQFFCILDLRRLKYASDDIFRKKDWRLNILNFAKEYEKARSLIMLRYGLYEFKSIRPSQEVLSSWKAANGIPDEDAPAANNAFVPGPSRTNGTEGILARSTTKRKAPEEPAKSQDRSAAPQTKRPRAVEREPLTETATPTLNKGNKKRMSDQVEDLEEKTSTKVQRPPPSATKKFFEQVANSKPTEPVSTPPSVQNPFAHLSANKPKPGVSTPSLFGAKPNGAASRSVFDSGAKSATNNTSMSTMNPFQHLSPAGSTQVSGNENDAEDEDDSGEEESEVQEVSQSDEPSVAASGGVATPKNAAALFSGKKPTSAFGSSATSSEAGEASARATGPSLFDRITKGEDGKPKRQLEEDVAESLPPSTAASDSERAASPQKDLGKSSLNKTWSPDTPIKFASSKAGSLFPPTMTPKAGSALASQTTTVSSQAMFTPKFGQGMTNTPSIFATSVNGTSGTSLFGAPKESEPKPSAEAAGLHAAHAKSNGVKSPAPQSSSFMFGDAGKTAGFSTGGSGLFGAGNKAAAASAPNPGSKSPIKTTAGNEPAAPAAKKPMFGSVSGETAAPTFGLGTTQKTAFGQESSQEQLKFGSAPGESVPTFGLGTTKKPAFGQGSSLDKPAFGSAPGESPAPTFGLGTAEKKPFGQSSQPDKAQIKAAQGTDGSAPLFGAGASESKPNFGLGALAAPGPLFGSGSGPSASNAAPLFGISSGTQGPSAASVPSSEPPQTKPLFGFGAGQDSKPMFGGATNVQKPDAVPPTTSAASAPLFSFAAAAPKTTAAPSFSFGASAPAAAPSAPAPVLFGAGSTGGSTAAPAPSALFGSGATAPTTAAPSQSVLFGSSTAAPSTSFNFGVGQTGGISTTPSSFGGGGGSGGSGFTFSAGPSGGAAFNNPFASGGSTAAPPTFNFGGGGQSVAQPAAPSGGVFSFTSGAASGTATPSFNFGGGSQNGAPMFNLAPPTGGTSTGTNTPFTLGGASSLATTPAGGTPEPGAAAEGSEQDGQKTDGDEVEKQAQINLTEGGPGEEEEDVVFEVRAKALKLCPAAAESDDDGDSSKKKSPWKTMGVGPFRILKHKATGAVRALLRGEPRGNVVFNKSILPSFTYKPEKGDKYVKMVAMSDDGKELETWMLQVKNAENGKALADALENNKKPSSGADE